MARNLREDVTYISDREVVGSGLATSPTGVAWVRDIQQATYESNPAGIAEAQDKADQADTKAGNAQQAANTAQTAAEGAQATASGAQQSANEAHGRADDAYQLADGKVDRDVGPVFTAPQAVPSRAALPTYAGGMAGATYTQADMQALMDQVAALTGRVAALIIDGRANRSLTPQ